MFLMIYLFTEILGSTWMFSVLRGGKQCDIGFLPHQTSIYFHNFFWTSFKFDYSTWVSWVELLWIFCSKYFIQLSSAHWTVRILQNFNTNVFPISKAKGCYKKLKPYLEKKCPCMELLHLPHRRKDRISEGVGENVQDIQGVLLYRIYKKYVFHVMYVHMRIKNATAQSMS